MKLITWSPITRPTSIFNEIDSWFNNISTDFPSLVEGQSLWKPRFEVLDTNSAYRLRAELPGMVKKDVNIEISDNLLTISGKKTYGNKNLNNENNYSEFSYGKFSRSFNLPEDVKEDGIKASMKDGVLALEIPRMEQIKPEIKKISIK